MRTFSRYVLVATGYLVLTLAVVGTLPAQQQPESVAAGRVDVVIGALRGPTGVGVAPIIVGETGQGQHARLSVEIVPEPSVMVARLASGEIDLGMLPSNVAAQLYNRGVPVQIGAVTLWGLLYVVSSDETITDWQDLSGRTVHAISRGAGPDIMLRHILGAGGIDPERDVVLDYRFGHAELAQMVAAGEVETAVLPEPFVTQALSRRNDLSVRLDFQDAWRELYGTSYPQTVVIVRQEIARDNPEAVREALGAVRAGWEMMTDDPRRGGRLAAQANLGLPEAVVAQAIPRFNVEYVSAVDAKARLQDYFRILYESEPRSVGGALPDEGMYLPFQ